MSLDCGVGKRAVLRVVRVSFEADIQAQENLSIAQVSCLQDCGDGVAFL